MTCCYVLFVYQNDEECSFEDYGWFRALAVYGQHRDIDPGDSDVFLIPLVVEKVVIPKLVGQCINIVSSHAGLLYAFFMGGSEVGIQSRGRLQVNKFWIFFVLGALCDAVKGAGFLYPPNSMPLYYLIAFKHQLL